MNCLAFLDRLDDLRAGRVPAAEREALERHAGACPTCAALLGDARRSAGPGGSTIAEGLADEEAEQMVSAVLKRTAGSVCARAEEVLATLAFERVAGGGPSAEDGVDRELVAGHVEHCRSCAALAESLGLAARTLPGLAAIDPGPGFTFSVLAATSRAAQPGAAGQVVAWWQRWVARPRFAFELAYVATLLLVLIVGNPAASLQAASARTASVASEGLQRARQAWPAVAPKVPLPAGVRALGAATGEFVARKPALQRALEMAWERAASWWSSAWTWVGGVASDVMNVARAAWRAARGEPRGPTVR